MPQSLQPPAVGGGLKITLSFMKDRHDNFTALAVIPCDIIKESTQSYNHRCRCREIFSPNGQFACRLT